MTNVLLITVDSLRADHVGSYGYERPTTPVLDSFAAESVRYERAFSHACSTRPSFPAILSSVYPLMYGGYTRISESQTLLSEAFDAAGYRTGGFHSNAYLNPEFGYARGFDHFYDSMEDGTVTANLRQWVKTNLDGSSLTYRGLEAVYQLFERRAGRDVGSAYVDADDLTDRAIQWLEQGSEPTFLWVHYMDVHHPYLPPTSYQDEFRTEPVSDKESLQLRRKMLEQPGEIDSAERQKLLDLYDSEIRFVDHEIGRLLDAANAHWDDHVVAFTSDHGEEFEDHGRYSHHDTFYDEVVHVPLVVFDGERTGTIDELVGHVDLAPTLLSVAGVSPPPDYHGYSLPQETDNWPRDHVLGCWEPTDDSRDERRFAYRDTEWKFILDDGETELYDLTADPTEQTDVSRNHPDVASRLADVIGNFEAEVDATDEDLGQVRMDDEVKARLRDLGYKE